MTARMYLCPFHFFLILRLFFVFFVPSW